MPAELFANTPVVNLSGPIGLNDSVLTVRAASGFPSAISGVSQFRLQFSDTTGEIVIIGDSVSSGNCWLITQRGAENTVAAFHNDWAQLFLPTPTAGALSNLGSGNITSGQLSVIHLRSGTIFGGPGITVGWNLSGISLSVGSGLIQSGMIASGAVTSGTIASGTIGWSSMASGAIQSGNLGQGSVSSGNIASGQVGWPHLASGAAQSGNLGVQSVTSGNVASGSLDWIHHVSGFLTSGLYKSGSIGSGQIGAVHLLSGTLLAGAGIGVNHGLSGITLTNLSGSFALTSGIITSGLIGNNAVTSGNVASGSLDWPHLVSGYRTSGVYLSGSIGSGAVGAVHLISGTLIAGAGIGVAHGLSGITLSNLSGSFALTSGIITSGLIGNNAVTSGNLASGSIDWPHLRSGLQISGLVLSGGIGSGQVSWPHLASGAGRSGFLSSGSVNSGAVSSGQIDWWNLASGTVYAGTSITVTQTGSGIQISATGTLLSGTVQSGNIGNNAVTSGNIASGAVGWPHLASGAGRSGFLSSGSINSGAIGSGVVDWWNLASGVVYAGTNVIITQTGSGIQIAATGAALASGAVQSGNIGNQAVTSGNIASGAIGQTHVQSGLFWYLPSYLLNGGFDYNFVSGNITTTSGGAQRAFDNWYMESSVSGWQPGPDGNTSPPHSENQIFMHVGLSGGQAILYQVIPTIDAYTLNKLPVVFQSQLQGGLHATYAMGMAVLGYGASTSDVMPNPLVRTWSSGIPPTFASGVYPIASGSASAPTAAFSQAYVSGTVSGLPTFLIAAVWTNGIVSPVLGGAGFGLAETALTQGTSLVPWLPRLAAEESQLNYANVGSGLITSGSIGWPHLASGAVRSGAIVSGAVLLGAIGSGAVASGMLASGAVLLGVIGSGAVTSGTLASGTVVSGTIASGAVGTPQIGSGQVIQSHLASGVNAIVSGDLFRNFLINGGMPYAQRYTPTTMSAITSGASGTDTYSADRWKVAASSGGFISYQRWDRTASGLASGVTARFYGRWQIGGSGRFAIFQPIEADLSQPLTATSLYFQLQMRGGPSSSGMIFKMGVLQTNSGVTANTIPNSLVSGWSLSSGTDPTWGSGVSLITTATTITPTSGVWTVFGNNANALSGHRCLIPVIWANHRFASGACVDITEVGLYID